MQKRKLGVAVSVVIILITAGGAAAFSRPVPSVAAQTISNNPEQTTVINIPWPGFGQAAIGAPGYDVLAEYGDRTAYPTASVAKIMTALAILQKYPLKAGQSGPMVPITKADEALYDHYRSIDGSLVRVAAGEQITLYQALQGMLLPSGNNMADTLATWAYGSMPNYTTAANALAKTYGMTSTTISDASGFSPQTTSTARDLVLLGLRAVQQPALAGIVSQRSAVIPIAGAVQNTNWLLGNDLINGIKTGNTDQAGGVFLGSALRQLPDGRQVTVVSAVVHAPNLTEAMRATPSLLDAAGGNFVIKKPVRKNEAYGTYTTPWDNRTARAVAGADAQLTTWSGTSTHSSIKLDALHGPRAKGSRVGTITLSYNGTTRTIPLILDQAVDAPSGWWRLTHR